MVSVIIPARNERFLQPTIDDLLAKATGEVEIIVILDGYWPLEPLKTDPRVRIIHRGEVLGMRNAINSGAAIARGKYLMKIDAHCMVDEGWDEKLKADCERNWVVVPRRKRLDAENWCISDAHKPDVDYHFLSWPWHESSKSDFGGPSLNGRNWDERNKDESLKSILIDDLMTFQGSCWFMHRDYFYELELMDEETYGPFWNEAQEIGLKCWLSGGRVVVNKKTWYAHLHKGKKYGRGYRLQESWLQKGADGTRQWLNDSPVWHKQSHLLSWLIDKFMPVPTWPEERDKWFK